MDNAFLAERLEALAALLDLSGSSYYTVRAYRRAAELIRSTPADVPALVRGGRARELAGIGPAIEARLRELVETGELAELRELEAEALPELVGVGRLLGLSPKRMRELGHALGVRTLDELRAAVEAGRLQEARGVGPKTAARIRQGLEEATTARPRRGMLLNRARALVTELAEGVGGVPAGDPRRWCDLSTRFAVVVPNGALDRLERLPQVVAVLERDERRAVVVTAEGYPVEFVVAAPERLGTELLRATGSPGYVAALGPLPEAPTEEDVYSALGLSYRPPELREPGAPEAPADLVRLDDVRGDLHVHSTASDGKASVREMAEAALERGYEYLAICDHTQAVRVVPGLDADGLRRQAEEVAAVNAAVEPFRVLRGTECDVLPDGSLDLPDDVLAELDWVQVSLHAGQRWGREALTARVVEALQRAAALRPGRVCLSHPKGRILNHRPENALDLDRVFEVALGAGIALEVNGLPDRLDLSAEHARRALEAGVSLVCSTDAHSVRGLGNMALSVATARRAGARSDEVLNTRRLGDLVSTRH
ncbi:MAG TPA: helix-hairpin-helix domain-containing protein [Gaiellaceae bacterium]|nr:helix-hairpin-helix domain-containing protein [Gaiellaceae bacterium]